MGFGSLVLDSSIQFYSWKMVFVLLILLHLIHQLLSCTSLGKSERNQTISTSPPEGDTLHLAPLFLIYGKDVLMKAKEDYTNSQFSLLKPIIILINENEFSPNNVIDYDNNHCLILSSLFLPVILHLSYTSSSQVNKINTRLLHVLHNIRDHVDYNKLFTKGFNDLQIDQHGRLHYVLSRVNAYGRKQFVEFKKRLRKAKKLSEKHKNDNLIFVSEKKSQLLYADLLEERDCLVSTVLAKDQKVPSMKDIYEKSTTEACYFSLVMSSSLDSYLEVYRKNASSSFPPSPFVIKLINIKRVDCRRNFEHNTRRFRAQALIKRNRLTLMNRTDDALTKVHLMLTLTPATEENIEFMERAIRSGFKLSRHSEAQKHLHVTYLCSKEPIDGYFVELKEPFFTNCALQNLINSDVMNQDDKSLISVWLIELVDFIHSSLKQVHCNLKPHSIMLDSKTGKPKLRNISHAVDIKDASAHTQHLTLDYKAPEHFIDVSISKKGHPSDKAMKSSSVFNADIWALGCMIYQLLTGRFLPLFKNTLDTPRDNSASCSIKYTNGELIIEDLSEDETKISSKELLLGLLSINPTNRWSINQVKQSVWFKQIKQKNLKLSNQTMAMIQRLPNKASEESMTEASVIQSSKLLFHKQNQKKVSRGQKEKAQKINEKRLFRSSILFKVKSSFDPAGSSCCSSIFGPSYEFQKDRRYQKLMDIFEQRIQFQGLDQEKKTSSPSFGQYVLTDSPFDNQAAISMLKELAAIFDVVLNQPSLPDSFCLDHLKMDAFGHLHLHHSQNNTSEKDMKQLEKIIKNLAPSLKHRSLLFMPVKKDTFVIINTLVRQIICNKRDWNPMSLSTVADLVNLEELASMPISSFPIRSPYLTFRGALLDGAFEPVRKAPIPLDMTSVKCIYKGSAKNLYLCILDDKTQQSTTKFKHNVVIKQYRLSKFRCDDSGDSDFVQAIKHALYLSKLPNAHNCVAITYGASHVPKNLCTFPAFCLENECDTKDLRWEVMEPLGCDLHTLISDYEAKEILASNAADREVLAIYLVEILIFLHQAGLIHQDLKPQNVCFDLKTFRAKLIDFELSKLACKQDKDLWKPLNSYPTHGTWGYAAPEDIAREHYLKVSEVVIPNLWEGNVWCIGFMLYLIYVRLPHPLFEDTSKLTRHELTDAFCIYLKDHKINEPLGFIKKEGPIVKVIRGMLHPNPIKRMTLQKVLESEWWKRCKDRSSIALTLKLRKRIVELSNPEIIARAFSEINSYHGQYLNTN